uniref:Uncharacterized protein n=1 Tax=Cacopsylla melanoneura TaxID=428564 RepID=A0A8D8QEN1_9HEMI
MFDYTSWPSFFPSALLIRYVISFIAVVCFLKLHFSKIKKNVHFKIRCIVYRSSSKPSLRKSRLLYKFLEKYLLCNFYSLPGLVTISIQESPGLFQPHSGSGWMKSYCAQLVRLANPWRFTHLLNRYLGKILIFFFFILILVFFFSFQF